MDTDVDSNEPNPAVGIPDLSLVKAVRPVRANTLHNRIQEFMATTKSQCCVSEIYNTRRKLERFELYMARKKMDHSSLMHYGEWLLKRTTQDAAFRCVDIARALVRWLWRMRYISENLTDSFPKMVKPPSKSFAHIITEEEYHRLLEATKTTRMAWGIVLAYHTGLRLKDTCLLRWSEVDMDQQVIRVQPYKTRKRGIEAEIPVITDSDLHVWLLKMQADRIADEPFVSRALHASYLAGNGTCIARHYCMAFKKAGVKACFHSFRSTFESRLANSGISLAVAAKITGRTDARALMRYIIPDMDKVREGVAKSFERKTTIIINERRNNFKADQPTPDGSLGGAGAGRLNAGEAAEILEQPEGVPASWII